MTVLLTFALVFTIGFWSGALLLATSLILSERDTDPVPIRAPESRMFPSYQRYLETRQS